MPIINMVYKKKKGWKPWANTIAYYPLTSTSTVNECSWKNKPLTNTWVTFGTYKWVDCAYLDGSHFLKNETSYGLSWSFTALIWAYYVKISHVNYEQPRFYGDNNWNIWIWIEPYAIDIWYNPRWSETGQTLASDSGWKLLTVVYDWTNCKLYVNNANVDTTARSWYTYTDSKLWIGGYVPTPLYWKWWLSEFILENKARTAEQVDWYYNQTKSLYGIS
jgi:hypothetical protein